jgi:hypothetical protein
MQDVKHGAGNSFRRLLPRHFAELGGVDLDRSENRRMSGQALPDEARAYVDAMRVEENRVVVRCQPYETFASPPRHLHRNDQEEQITHWVSGTVPWDAPEPA